MSDIVSSIRDSTKNGIKDMFRQWSRFAFASVCVFLCGCQSAHVNHLENEDVHPITNIFGFRKEMRLAYIEMCKQEAQRDHGDDREWAGDCLCVV